MRISSMYIRYLICLSASIQKTASTATINTAGISRSLQHNCREEKKHWKSRENQREKEKTNV